MDHGKEQRPDKDNSKAAVPADLSKWRCPGVFRGIEFRDCPGCGAEVEFFPQDQTRRCQSCGIEVARVSGSCLSHCPAKQSDCYRQRVRAQVLSERQRKG